MVTPATSHGELCLILSHATYISIHMNSGVTYSRWYTAVFRLAAHQLVHIQYRRSGIVYTIKQQHGELQPYNNNLVVLSIWIAYIGILVNNN